MALGFDFYAALRELLEQVPEDKTTTPRHLACALGDPVANLAVIEALGKKEFQPFKKRIATEPYPHKIFTNFDSDKLLRRLADKQRIMAERVILDDHMEDVSRVAGVDAAYSGNKAYAACVVMDREFKITELRTAVSEVAFPYIPRARAAALMRRGGSINEFMMSGGQATVATPEFSQIVYCWRTRSLPDQEAITRVIERCAQGAALVTNCERESRLITAVRTGLPNSVLTDTMMENLRAIGPPRHTKEDIEFARKIQENLGLETMEQPYDEGLTEPEHAYDKFHPADDVNEFTWHAPSVRLYVSKSLAPVPGFRYPRWVVAALCGTGATHRMGETAAKVMTATALDLLERPELLARAREEFEKRKKKHCEAPLVPEGLSPPIGLRWPEWVDRPGSEWWIPP